jgi:hypothetical protein
MNKQPESLAPIATDNQLPTSALLGRIQADHLGAVCTLVDAALLVESILTNIAAAKDELELREQVALAAMSAREVGPRLAKLAGVSWLPNVKDEPRREMAR